MLTINEVQKVCGVTRLEAYGLMRFFENKGVVTVAHKKTGKAGKPENMYAFGAAPRADVIVALEALLNASVEATLAAQKAADDAQIAAQLATEHAAGLTVAPATEVLTTEVLTLEPVSVTVAA